MQEVISNEEIGISRAAITKFQQVGMSAKGVRKQATSIYVSMTIFQVLSG